MAAAEDDSEATTTSSVHEGEILRKKNIRNQRLILTVKSADEPKSRPHVIPRDNPYNFLFPGSIVRVISSFVACNDDGITEGKDTCVAVDDIQLIKSSSDPTCVRTALKGVLDGRHDAGVICSTKEELDRLLGADQSEPSREVINTLTRRIQGKADSKGPPRKRLPHTSKMDVALLQRLEDIGRRGEKNWKLQCPALDGDGDVHAAAAAATQSSTSASLPLNLPIGADSDRRRVEYINRKKEPQIQWMIRRMREGGFVTSNTKSIVDVGGGRGDLAVRIALEFSHTTVTIVDVNERSLQAAKEYAEAMGVACRVRTLAQDFTTFDEDDVDLVCGLHACGDLSDLAIHFAQRKRCNFMLCPCCYTKRYIQGFTPKWCGLCYTDDQTNGERQGDGDNDTRKQSEAKTKHRDNSKVIAKLAETDFQLDISSRARCLINSMRLDCISEEYSTTLGMYSSETSKRNLVLMGKMA